MPFIETGIRGLLLFEPVSYKDNRGYFFESYNRKVFEQHGMNHDFVQDNQSFSVYGVVRGLHYQLNPHAQAKLVRAISGKILDVAVDIRIGSPSYKKVFAVELSAENKKQLFIPAGFAHGFSVLSETAEVLYKCDKYYNKESEGGIVYNDAELNIDWQIPAGKAIVSEKDLQLPELRNAQNNFHFNS
jgi:dTDP-4-dehydrorhamnose 3,5-epimerase